MVDRRARLERDAGRELASQCIGFSDGARVQSGEDCMQGPGLARLREIEATDWVSDTSVRWKVGQGVQGFKKGTVMTTKRSGSVTRAWPTEAIGERDTGVADRVLEQAMSPERHAGFE